MSTRVYSDKFMEGTGMSRYRFFVAMFTIGMVLGGSVCGQSLSADPHDRDFGVAEFPMMQPVVETAYLTGDPHQENSVVFPDQQLTVRTTYISGDPHDDGQLDIMLSDNEPPEIVLSEEWEPAIGPYLIGDPHYQAESEQRLALK